MRLARAFHLTPTERAKVVSLALAGTPTSVLMRRFEITKTAVQNILRNARKTTEMHQAREGSVEEQTQES